MCHVQRVTNSCGHQNDHVLLVCRVAKAALASPPAYADSLDSGRHKLAVPIGDGDSADGAAGKSGFHACTQPYCIYASVKTLTSAKGFKCMVAGCGQAD